MSYSRRQLEALGEPFGDSATQSKPGGRIYGGGGGGGTPATQTQITELPEWARGYAQQTLQLAEGLTTPRITGKEPYPTYGAERIAGFSPLQQQAQQAAGTLGPAAQIGQATGLAGLAGTEAFKAGQYTPGQFMAERTGTGSFTQPGMAAQYMSPYIEQALAPQLREAQRTSDILGTQQAGQAVQSGAFGGSRAGLLEAERQRNLGMQLGDIRARGLQSAYEQAQQLYGTEQQRALQSQIANQQAGLQAQQLGEQSRQYGAGLGLQGLGTALSAAGQLGQLGQQQFGQQKDVLGLQSQFGAQQQALRQQGLTQSYQDFLNQQNYPYKQLGFMSDLIRGLPLGQQSSRQIYEGSPGLVQSIGSLGMGAYGLSKLGMFAEGGSVTDDAFVEAALDKMSDTQLAEAERAAIMRNDMKRINMIAEEKAVRASERQGLAGAFNQIPQATQESMVSAARGGILAFKGGGADDSEEGEEETSGGDYGDAPGPLSEFPLRLAQMPLSRPRTTEEFIQAAKTRAKGLGELYGDSGLQPFTEALAKQEAGLAGQREEGKGLIALAAAQALSSTPGLRQGIGQMFGAIGTEAAKMNKDIRDSQRLIQQSKLHLAQAEQARNDRRMGVALDLEKQADADLRAAEAADRRANLTAAQILSRREEGAASRTAAEKRSERQATAQLEAARISASRPGETAQTISSATKAFIASGLTPEEAQLKAVEMVLGRSSITDWSRARDDLLAAMLAKDATLKDDPVRLAEAKASAGEKAASNLRGFGQRGEAAAGKEDVDRIRAMQGDIRYIQAASRAGSDDPKIRQRGERELEALRKEFKVNEPAAPAAARSTNAPPSSGFPQPTAAAISALKSGLGTREQFDETFGPGAAAKVLGK